MQAALAAGSRDNATALVVRVARLGGGAGRQRLRPAMPVPPRLKVGDLIDGHTVTAIVSDNGINILYQESTGDAALYALKTLHPARPRSRGARDARPRGVAGTAHGIGRAAPITWSGCTSRPRHARYYLLYDWHGGETLRRRCGRTACISLQRAQATTGHPAARTLGRLHRQGVIHRDVKPANLHQGDDATAPARPGRRRVGPRARGDAQLHAGTPSYMNPEQWGSREEHVPADAGSDLFALGVRSISCSPAKLPYGEVLPYQRGATSAIRRAQPHRPEVPIWLDHVVLKAVARDRRQRFETAEEMLLALERGASRPLAAPRRRPSSTAIRQPCGRSRSP